MCDPISLGIGGATKGASMYMQKKAAKKVEKKRAGVRENVRRDVEGMRDDSRAALEASKAAAGPGAIQAGMAQAEADRTADYQAGVDSDPQAIITDNSSAAVKNNFAKQLAAAVAGARDKAQRRAAFEAYGATAFGRDIMMNRHGQRIDRNATDARRRAEIGEMELEEANSAGEKYANLAGLIDAAGMIGGAAYGAGAGSGMWGGKDPLTGITWNSGRAAAMAQPQGPVNPNYFGPYRPGQVGYYR